MASSRNRAFQVKIVGDVNDAKRKLGQMEKRMGGFAKAMKGVAGAMVAAFAVQKVAAFVGDSIKRAEEMNSLYAITEKVIEQTGGAAGRTADEVKEMAKQLSLTTGIDKKLITEGTNVLLTFKNIADQAGEGNDIFTRSNEIMLDMSTVFGGDAKSAATQLGKALNDPIAGVSSLARVGVTFTDQQKKQIKTLQESGDILGAQQIIMAELEGQIGGTAVASADATAKLSNMANEAKEAIGNKLLPIVERLADFMIETVVPAFQRVSDWISTNVPPWYEKHIKPTVEAIQKIVEKVVGWLSKFWKEHGDKIIKEVKILADLVIGYYTAIFETIQKVLGPVIEWLAGMWEKHGDRIMKAVEAWWAVVSTILAYAYDAVKDLVRLVTALIKGDWSEAWEIAKGMVGKFGDFVRDLGPKILGYLTSLVTDIGPIALDIGKQLVDKIVSGVGGMASAIRSAAGSAARAMMNAFIDKWNRLDPRISLPTMTLFGKTFGGQTSPDLLPDIPRLAKGGIATGPMLAEIGEGRFDEAVIPLRPGMGLGGSTYNVTIETLAGDPAEIGSAVVDAIQAFERSAGESWRSNTAAGF